MNMNDSAPWVLDLICPFCKEVIINTIDPSQFFKEMNEEEKFHYIFEMREFDHEPCEHVAFRSNLFDYWNVEYDWEDQMGLLAKALVGEIPRLEVAEIIARASRNEVRLKEIAMQVLPNYEVAITTQTVKWEDCCGISPTYVLIFLKKRT